MNLIEDYQPLVQNQAWKLGKSFNVDAKDLEQEGNLMLWQIQEAGNLGDNAKAISSYVRLRVIGAMKKYIAKNNGPAVVPDSAFWDGDRASIGAMELVHTGLNPENEYLSKESAMEFDMKVKALKALLTPREIAILEEMILSDEPLTTREMAVIIGVNSPQTVVNIRNRILKKAKGVFNGNAD